MTELNQKMKGRYHISNSWMVEGLSDTGDKVEILNNFLSSINFLNQSLICCVPVFEEQQ
jgi:hypothetical protein